MIISYKLLKLKIHNQINTLENFNTSQNALLSITLSKNLQFVLKAFSN